MSYPNHITEGWMQGYRQQAAALNRSRTTIRALEAENRALRAAARTHEAEAKHWRRMAFPYPILQEASC
jgi:cob(I)alamin adenosyltransferase